MSNSVWLFTANNGTNGAELWRTDGTTAGTALVKDIYSGSYGSSPGALTELGNGRVVFTANDGVHGNELWVTDGTAAGTSLLKNIDPADPAYGGNPVNITALGDGRAVFTTTISRLNDSGDLWVTDGTAAGTVQIEDIYSGTTGNAPGQFTIFGKGKVAFTAWDTNAGYELWISDTTAGGTFMLKGFGYANGGGGAEFLTPLGNGRMIFSAWDSANGRELWVTDGTAIGTQLVKDISAGTGSSLFQPQFTALGNGKALFVANDGVHGSELWVSNGAAAGTSLLKDFNAGSGGSTIANFFSMDDGRALFAVNDGSGTSALWVSDGTAAGTIELNDFDGINFNGAPKDFQKLGNGKVVFLGTTATKGTEFWVTDGTVAGTKILFDLSSGSGSGITETNTLTALGNGKYVFAGDGGWPYMRELWVTDLSAAGSSMVKDLTTGFGNSSYLYNFEGLGNGKAMFAYGTSKEQLWVTDGTGTGTALVKSFTGAVSPLFELHGTDRIGSPGGDTLIGDVRANSLLGRGGNDWLEGNAGADTLNGGVGADTMLGGAGNDTYTVDSAGDQVVESTKFGGTVNAGGTDVVNASLSYTLPTFVEQLVLTGSTAINGTGNAGANTITGNSASNVLRGYAGADSLVGAGGDDKLYGGLGKDTLHGGLGADTFMFDTGATPTGNVDQIQGFERGSDRIGLDDDIFGALGVTGTSTGAALDASRFVSGTAALDADDRIIYDQSTGTLYYDADGTGATAKLKFAVLGNAPALDATDFLVFS